MSVALILAAGLASAVAQAAVPTPPAASEPSPEAEALSLARSNGSTVEVLGLKSETSRVLALPSGSLVLEQYAAPRWTTDQGGGWRQIDTRLTVQDGAIAPVATLASARFSAGGAEPLASLPLAGGLIRISWPTPLPAPRLEGDTAVYDSVLPGVDLRVRSLADGFTWVLVVHDAQAARNQALTRLRFSLATSGLTARNRAGGGFEVLDAAGAVALSAGDALMWDAGGQSTTADVTGAQDQDSVLRAVPDSARTAQLSTRIENGELVIVPDTAMLTGSDTAFPVVIDPWMTIGKTRWGYADSANANRDDGIVRVGKNPDGSGIYRSFFSFNLAMLAGKTIRSAKFITTMKHSWSCDSTPVNLWRSADLTSSGRQAWDGPNLQLWIQERSGHAHKPSSGDGCGSDPQPDLYLEFAAAALKNDIVAAGATSNYTLALSTRQHDGTSESTTEWWKKFDQAKTKLSIEYNTAPNTPTGAQLTTHTDYTAGGLPCATGTARPQVRSTSPWLKATLTDPDGVNSGALSGTFTLNKWSGTAWGVVVGWPKTDSGVPHGTRAEVQAAGLVTGGRYRWQVRAGDSLGGKSDLSPWCEFDIDATSPEKTPTVTTADGVYLETPPNNALRGGLGRSAQFTFGANGVGDVVDFLYQLDGGPEMTTSTTGPGGGATVWVTPMHAGENVLTVRSRDQAGNRSAPYDYRFLVDVASSPKAMWAMNEGTGTSLATTPAGGPTADLTDGSWQDGRIVGVHQETGRESAVFLDGIHDYAATAGSVVDTSRSFSVAAWVRLDSKETSASAVSQQGIQVSAFRLGYRSDTGKWCFTVRYGDLPTSSQSAACEVVPRVGVWTHLAGVYDIAARKIRLYVDGVRVAEADAFGLWTSSRSLAIGRAWYSTAVAELFTGAISEVAVWDRVIEPDLDLAPLVQPTEVGEWDMEDSDEVTWRAADASGYERPLTLSGPPSGQWCVDGYNLTGAVQLDGAAGVATTADPVVRTDQSFTVTARVRLSQLPAHDVKALAQDDSSVAGFSLGARNYSGQYYWSFLMKDSGISTSISRVARSATALGAADVNRWVHLAGVYYAPRSELRVYVDGVLKQTVKRESSPGVPIPGWQALGGFTVGRERYNAAPTGFFPGCVDQVRAWQGALTNADITAAYQEQ